MFVVFLMKKENSKKLLLLLLPIYFNVIKPEKVLQNNYIIVVITHIGMLIKVSTIIYKTKINIRIKAKIKISYILINKNKKTNKKADSNEVLSPKFSPTSKWNPS